VVLASTLSSVYGIYNGFELCENTPVPGKEEYLNSEKYEFKVWDWDRPGNIVPFISRLNQVREAHPALQEYDNLRFFEVQNDSIIGYTKATPDNSDIVVVLCNLNPFETQSAWFNLPLSAWGIAEDHQYLAADELADNVVHSWTGSWQHITMDPQVNPAVILHIRPWQHVEYVDLVP
jgi:starch synthase (maltosyl-transferring)